MRIKAAVCGLLGLVRESRDCVQRLLALNPDTTIATVRALNRLQMQRNPLGFAAFLDGLRVSGLPEE